MTFWKKKKSAPEEEIDYKERLVERACREGWEIFESRQANGWMRVTLNVPNAQEFNAWSYTDHPQEAYRIVTVYLEDYIYNNKHKNMRIV